MFKTRPTKKEDIDRKWYIIDASDKVLGRLATEVARLLSGKDKLMSSHSMDLGDNVVIINASKVAVTGNKMRDKKYYRHSNYPGGFKEMNLEQANV